MISCIRGEIRTKKNLLQRLLQTLLSGIMLVAGGYAHGATIYWKGSTNSNWNTPSNWSGGTVPATGDVVNIGNGNSFTNQPTISSTPSGTPATINIGSTQAVTLTVNSGSTLNAGTIAMTPSSSNTGNVAVNGILNVNNITTNSYSTITLGSSSTLYLSGNITGGGTLTPSTAATAKIILDGTTNTQSFGTGSFNLSNNVGVLDIVNTYNASSTSRGVTFTGGTINHVIVEANAIFNANGSLVEGTNYYATIRANALYISRSTFNLHASDSINVSATLQFTAANQVINLYKTNANGSNVCPNVIFTGTSIAINGGPATYAAGNANNNSVFLVRGNLDITSSTSTIIYTGITLIDINGSFSGSTALSCGSIPVNIAGSWTNTDTDDITGVVTYDGTTGSSTQVVSTNVTYGNDLVFTGASPKKVNTGTLQVAGDFNNSAGSSVDLVSNTTTTLMNGTSAQTIAGGTNTNSTYSTDVVNGTIFYNLTIATGGSTTADKTATLSGYNNIAPGGILDLNTSGGRLDATANNSLTLMSTAAGSAAVDDLTNGGTLTGANLPVILGTVYVQRFLTGGSTVSGGVYVYRGYRLLSSPVNVTSSTASTSVTAPNYISLSYLKGYALNGITYTGAFIAGTGGTSGGFSAYNANPTVYFYNEKLASSNTTFISGKNVGITTITSTQVTLTDGGTYSVPVGNGYIMYYVGPNSRTSGLASAGAPINGLMTAPGYLNQGTITATLWYTPANSTAGHLSYNTPALIAAKAGFNMLGNPYASSLNLSTVLTDNTGIDAIYLLNNRNPSQAYVAYTASGTSAPSSGYAVSGEGFIVHATGTGKTFTFKETQKAAGTQLTGSALVMAANPTAGHTLTGLYVKLEKDSTIYDYCGIYFSSNWSDNYEEGDAMDLDGATSTVYMSSYTADQLRTAVNHMGDYEQKQGKTIQLYANATTDGLYAIKIEGLRNMDTTLYTIWLRDKYKKDSLDIGRYGTYNFNIIRADTNSFGANRFELVIARKALPAYQLVSFTAAKVSAGVQLTWKVYNEGNYTGFTIERQDGSQFSPLYVRQSDGSTTYTYIDTHPVTGVNTYRLKQSDIDDQISYSTPVSVSYGMADNSLFNVYPNPARQTININLNITKDSMAHVTPSYQMRIYNSAGAVMMQKQVNSIGLSQDVSAFTPGAYTVELKNNDGTSAGRSIFIKVQ